MSADVNLQPTLTGARVIVRPVVAADWEGMFVAAAELFDVDVTGTSFNQGGTVLPENAHLTPGTGLWIERKEPGDAADEQDRVDQFITPTLSRAVRVVV